MKKLFYSVFALAALASCEAVVMEGDGTNNIISAPKEMVNVTVNVPANESRVAYSGNDASFEVGDQIAIRVHDVTKATNLAEEQIPYIFTCSGIVDGVAQFTGQLPAIDGSVQIGANYPATLESVTGENWCRVYTPYSTEYIQNTIDELVESRHYMKASADLDKIDETTEFNLAFQGITQYFMLNITNNIGTSIDLQGVELIANGDYFRVNSILRMHTYTNGYDGWVQDDHWGKATTAKTMLATPQTLANGESYKIALPFFANPAEDPRQLSVKVITEQGDLIIQKGTTPSFGYMSSTYINTEISMYVEDKDVVDAENLSKTLEYDEKTYSIPVNLPFGKDVIVELVSLKDSEDNDMPAEYVWTAEINTATSSIDIEANLENMTTKNIVAKFSVACEGKDTQYIYITQKYIDAYFYANTVAGTYASITQTGIENGHADCGGHCPFSGMQIYTKDEILASTLLTDDQKATITTLNRGYAIPTSDNFVFVFDFNTDTFSNPVWVTTDGGENAYGFAPISFEEGCWVVDLDKDGNADKVTMIINCRDWKVFTKVYTK